MSTLFDTLKLAAMQDYDAIGHQMQIRIALINRGIYAFQEPPPLERQNHYVFDPIKDAEYKPFQGGYVHIANALQTWMDSTLRLSVIEIIDGILQMRTFFQNESISWMHPTIRDMSIIHMLRTKAPPSQNLNIAIRTLILDGPESERTMMVRAFQETDVYDAIGRALQRPPRDMFLSTIFRRDCEIALACASINLNDGAESLLALRYCVQHAAPWMRRIPLIMHHHWYEPLTVEAMQQYMSWSEEPVVAAKCAQIMGLVL